MKAALLVVIAGCVDAGDPVWRIDHDRIIAVRAEPPAIQPGQSATLSALVVDRSEGIGTVVEQPVAVTVISPRELFAAAHFNVDHWQIDCPPVAMPTPLVVEMRFPAGDVATKTITLGDTHANPPPPTFVAPDPVPLHTDVELPEAEWFTSCGSLDGTTLRVDKACHGELVAVIRDPAGGVAWQLLSFVAR